MHDVAILILAAGASSRMQGRDKLLLRVDNMPLVRRVATNALATNCPVFVTLPALNQHRMQALAGLALTQVEIKTPQDGMAASLTAGLRVLPSGLRGVMMVLGDMPDVSVQDLHQLLAAFDTDSDKVMRATNTNNRPGHPVIFPARLFDELAQLSGDIGARDILQKQEVMTLALPGNHATTDLDTPQDWDNWRRANPLRH